jgi:transcriptional/translational regulatory protein YebC/TACO1
MKGTGELGAENYENVVYEGYGPGGVAMMVEALTNNRSRTAPELRKIFEVSGGNLAQSGSVSFQFGKQGLITIKAEDVGEDKLIEVALDAGAEDVRNEGEAFIVITGPTVMHKVKDAIAAAGINISPTTPREADWYTPCEDKPC